MKRTLLTIIITVIGVINTWGAKANSTPMSFLQPDGTTITVVLHGDEDTAWFTSADGVYLCREDNAFYVARCSEGRLVAEGVLAHNAGQRTADEMALIARQDKAAIVDMLERSIAKGNMRKIGIADRNPGYVAHTGSPKVLVVLAEYADMPFTVADPQKSFEQFFNASNTHVDFGNSENRNYFSVREYFKEMSAGAYTPEFTVAGPVKVGNMGTYGGTSDNPNDENTRQLVTDAVTGCLTQINLSDFDNDGDGVADIVYIIYSGYGQNTGGDNNTVWAKTGSFNQTIGNTKVAWYSCASELNLYPDYFASRGTAPYINGIGVTCHEFSHAMGLPDIYPTSSSAHVDNQEMEYWDLMDGGEYIYNGYRPKDYTAWEREVMGWMTIDRISQDTENITIKPLLDGGRAYKFVNPANEDEYFVMENIQKRGLNQSIPGHGLIVYHVYYPWAAVSMSANPNNTAGEPGMAIVPADGACLSSYLDYTSSQYRESHGGDPFPGTQMKTELNHTQNLPNYRWYTGSEKVTQALYDITENVEEGTVTLSFTTDYDAYASSIRSTGFADSTTYFDIQGRRMLDGSIRHNQLYINNGKTYLNK